MERSMPGLCCLRSASRSSCLLVIHYDIDVRRVLRVRMAGRIPYTITWISARISLRLKFLGESSGSNWIKVMPNSANQHHQSRGYRGNSTQVPLCGANNLEETSVKEVNIRDGPSSQETNFPPAARQRHLRQIKHTYRLKHIHSAKLKACT
jgi:hypothetical protein